MTPSHHACPACGAAPLSIFYAIEQVPVHSVLLLPTREAALNYPKGDIRLGFCDQCGFITNTAFDPRLHEYSERYEETQGFSETFNAFARSLAERLIDRYDLRGKQIIEIGCGKGEFLTLLCELGANHGLGFDPAYISERSKAPPSKRVTFVKDVYSERYAQHQADFVCCKMTLEHIPQVAEFVTMVRRSTASRPDTIVFFQIPDVARILSDVAFWDVYYEHCSYFSAGSLARLFRRCGFEVIDLAREYGDQYLMIEARPASGAGHAFPELEDDLAFLRAGISTFAETCRVRQAAWRAYLDGQARARRRVVLWGSGSKGVAFLTTLGVREAIEFTVDINPHKHGTFMAGTGQQIVAPTFLRTYQPDVVIAMNPIYRDEIGRSLNDLGLASLLITAEDAIEQVV